VAPPHSKQPHGGHDRTQRRRLQTARCCPSDSGDNAGDDPPSAQRHFLHRIALETLSDDCEHGGPTMKILRQRVSAARGCLLQDSKHDGQTTVEIEMSWEAE
jgi:hypothetical protein